MLTLFQCLWQGLHDLPAICWALIWFICLVFIFLILQALRMLPDLWLSWWMRNYWGNRYEASLADSSYQRLLPRTLTLNRTLRHTLPGTFTLTLPFTNPNPHLGLTLLF